MPSKQRLALIILLTFVALIIRLGGIDFGLPYSYHIDEHFYSPYAWAMGQGRLNLPDQSHGPSLYLATLLIGQQIIHLLSFSQLSPTQFGTLIDANPWPFLLSARIVSALAGALTIPFVYLIGRRYRSHTIGLAAAALMAILFFHVRDSHFGVPDSFMTLFVAISGWLALRAHQTGHRIDFWLAGLCAGLATASKYTSVFIFIPVICAVHKIPTAQNELHVRQAAGSVPDKTSKLRLSPSLLRLLIATLGLITGFGMGYPNILINFPAFVKDISFLSVRVTTGFEGWRIVPDNSAIFYLSTLIWSIGLVTVILSAIGLIAALVRRTANDLIITSFPITYFVALSLSLGHFGRYMLPMLPFLTVLTADVCLVSLPKLITPLMSRSRTRWSRLYWPPTLGALVFATAIVPNTANSLRLDWVLAQPDTRTLAKGWIETHIDAGARLAVEWPYHTPPLSNGYQVPPGSKREYWIDLVYGFGLADRPIQQYQTDGTQFIIATSYIADIPVSDPQKEAARQRFYEELPHAFQEIKTFSPRCDGGQPEFIFDQIYGPAVDLWNLCYAGPLIRIYQVNRP